MLAAYSNSAPPQPLPDDATFFRAGRTPLYFGRARRADPATGRRPRRSEELCKLVLTIRARGLQFTPTHRAERDGLAHDRLQYLLSRRYLELPSNSIALRTLPVARSSQKRIANLARAAPRGISSAGGIFSRSDARSEPIRSQTSLQCKEVTAVFATAIASCCARSCAALFNDFSANNKPPARSPCVRATRIRGWRSIFPRRNPG